MLMLYILTAATIASIEAQTSVTLVKRSPAVTASAASEPSNIPEQMDSAEEQTRTKDKLKAVRALLALPMHGVSVFDSFVPATKRQRINALPTATEIYQSQPAESPRAWIGDLTENNTMTSPESPTATNFGLSENHTVASTESPTATNFDSVQQDATTFKLLRNLTTVNEVWQEYKYGLNGRPSVESLFGSDSTRMHNQLELSYYYNRRKIYNYIKKEIEKGKNEAEVVNELESLRVEQKWSLSLLQLKIISLTKDQVNGKLILTKPIYELMRNLTTVPEVWKEYKYGMNGSPSVEGIVKMYGVKWADSHNERVYYYGRKKIYDYIKSAINDSDTEEEVVNQLEQLRVEKNWTLQDLQIHFTSKSLDRKSIQPDPAEPVYKMLRNLTTVSEVWNEYKYGLNGNPSVKDLVQEYGIARLHFLSDSNYYYNRKKIYDYILNAINDGHSELDAVNELEAFRQKYNLSLAGLQKQIQPNNKETGELVPGEVGYSMLRNLTTVNEVWLEYKIGLYGYPSVESLVEKYDMKWARSKSIKSFYYRRLRICDYIKTLIGKGKSESDAVDLMEKLRVSQNWTLGNVQFNIKSIKYDDASGNVVFVKPNYVQLHNLTTVPQVWQEYKYGVNGNPSVESIVEQYGKQWLRTVGEEIFFNRRNRIYEYIKNAIANGSEEADAVKELEEYRLSKNWSLFKLQSMITFSDNGPMLPLAEDTGPDATADPGTGSKV